MDKPIWMSSSHNRIAAEDLCPTSEPFQTTVSLPNKAQQETGCIFMFSLIFSGLFKAREKATDIKTYMKGR